MANKLSWFFDLVDGISGPAKKMEDAIGALEKRLAAVSGSGGGSGGAPKAFESLNKSAKTSKSTFGELATAWNQTIEIAQKVTDAVAGIAEVGFNAGKFVVDTASYKTATITALQSILHVTRDEAKDVFGQIAKIASTTPFQTGDVTNTIKKLIGSGFSKDQAFALFQNIGDVSAFNNFDTEVLDRMATALGRINSQGKLTGESLEMILDASKGALGRQDIAKALGMTVDQLGKVPIAANKAIPAIQKVLTEKVSGGSAGSLMGKMGQEIPGLLSTLKDVPFTLIPAVDDSKGLTEFRSFLQRVVKLFDDSPAFKKLQASVGSLIDTLFGGFKGLDQGTLETLFNGVADAIQSISDNLSKIDIVGIFQKVGTSLSTVLPALLALGGGALEGLTQSLGPLFKGMESAGANAETWRALGKAIGFTVGAVVFIGKRFYETFTTFMRWGSAIYDVIKGLSDMLGISDALAAFWDELKAELDALADVFDGLYDAAVNLASDFIDGLVQGIENGAQAVIDAVSGLGTNMLDTAKGVLGIASPSREMMKLGRFAAMGFNMGFENEASNMNGLMQSSMAVPSASSLSSAIGGSGSAPAPLSVGDVNVHVGAPPAGTDPKQFAQDVGQAVRDALRDLLEANRRPAAA